MRLSEEDRVAWEEAVELLKRVGAVVRQLEFSAMTSPDEKTQEALLKKSAYLRHYFLMP